MSKGKILGLAAAALLSIGVQQIAGAATAAAQDVPAETSAAPATVATAAYRGNIYGSHGVIGHIEDPATSGENGATPHRYHHRQHYGHRYYRHHFYGARRYYPRFYAHRYYPRYYGAARYYPPYYGRRYYPRPVAVSGYYGGAGYYPQYYSRGYYPGQPVVATTNPLAPTNWGAACYGGRVCTGGYTYYRGVPVCSAWAACNY